MILDPEIWNREASNLPHSPICPIFYTFKFSCWMFQLMVKHSIRKRSGDSFIKRERHILWDIFTLWFLHEILISVSSFHILKPKILAADRVLLSLNTEDSRQACDMETIFFFVTFVNFLVSIFNYSQVIHP